MNVLIVLELVLRRYILSISPRPTRSEGCTYFISHNQRALPSSSNPSSIPNIIRTRMEEVAPRRNVQIRNHADLRVIDIHDRKLRYTSTSSQSRVIDRPLGLVVEAVVRVGVGVHVGDEGDEPVLHVLCDGGVVDAYWGKERVC